jgi:hypothetical protein
MVIALDIVDWSDSPAFCAISYPAIWADEFLIATGSLLQNLGKYWMNVLIAHLDSPNFSAMTVVDPIPYRENLGAYRDVLPQIDSARNLCRAQNSCWRNIACPCHALVFVSLAVS